MSKSRCFIAMPVTTRPAEVELYGDPDHWEHVLHTLFIPAVERADMTPLVPTATGSTLIHANIIKQLQDSDVVLCDLSSHNPNVFFELGVRTSLNLPIALVRDEHTSLPFDTSGINTESYRSTLRGWETIGDISKLAAHLESSVETCAGRNPLWQAFGLTIQASEASSDENPTEAKLDLVLREFENLRQAAAQSARQGGEVTTQGTVQSRTAPAMDFRKLSGDDVKAPAPLRAFAKDSSVFRDDLGRPIAFLRVIGNDGTLFIKQAAYDAIPIASRRAMVDMAKDRRIDISVIPD